MSNLIACLLLISAIGVKAMTESRPIAVATPGNQDNSRERFDTRPEPVSPSETVTDRQV